jgi:UDP-glucuronate decarboxylase
MKPLRILVTGGAGFIGTQLCRHLRDVSHCHYHVICLDDFSSSPPHPADLPGIEIIRHDVCDPIHLQVDQIYHLACPASPVAYQRDPVRTIETAVLGTRNVLRLARDVGARVVIASTSEVYGDPLVHPQPEIYPGNVNPLGPRACYDEGKRCAESLCAAWVRQYRTDVRIGRLFNVYGPTMALNDGRLLPALVQAVVREQPLPVHGDGIQTRSWCHVEDMVRALRLLMECETPWVSDRWRVPVVNLGNPDERTVLEVARLVQTIAAEAHRKDRWRYPEPKEIEFGQPHVDDPARRCPDITLARQLLGWEPTVPLCDGLPHAVQGLLCQAVG